MESKPVVYYTGKPKFFIHSYRNIEVASVSTVNHPVWGSDDVRTSEILHKFDDGSFETINHLYKPYTDMEGS